MSRFGLPHVLHEIADAAGREAALLVARTYGGTHFFFPRRPKADHALSKLVGHDNALRICRALTTAQGGIRLIVPMGPKASEVEKWRRVQALIDKGCSIRDIARAMGMHRRTVEMHKAGSLKRVQRILAQKDLFPTS